MSALLCARERTARAEGPSVEAPPPRHVEIKLVAPREDRELVAVLSELLDRLQVTTRFTTVPNLDTEEMWTPHPGEPSAIARAWIDLREPRQVTLYLTGDRQDRVLVRQVPLVLNLDEVAREEIAHIVEAAVDELLLGGQIGVEKKHTAELPPHVTLPGPLPEPPLRLDVGFGYAAQGWKDSSAPLHGPAAFVSLAKKGGPWRPGAFLSAELRFPQSVRGEGVSAGVEQGAVRLVFIADRSLSRRWMVRGGLGGGIDWMQVEPSLTATDPGDPYEATVSGPRLVAIPMLRGLALARYAFTTKSELFFGLAADFDIVAKSYVTQRIEADGSTTSSTVLNPWRLRPMALIGITADVLAY